MKIILIQDVKSLGKKGDVVEVNIGYGRNYIVPKKLGVEATKKNLNDLAIKERARKKEEQEILDEAKAVEAKIKDATVKLELKAGEGGRTFGSITSKEIATSAKEQFDIEIDRKKIQLAEPIKSAGEYEVEVKLHPEVTAVLKTCVKAV